MTAVRTLLLYLMALAAVAAGVRFGFPEWFESADGEVEAAANPNAPPPVVVAEVEVRPLVADLEALGTVRANESVQLRPHRADWVSSIKFEDGMHVEAGAVLVELHDAEEQAELSEAIAIRDERRAAYERSDELFAKEVESGGRRLAAKAQLDAADARVRRLQSLIADHKVVAPFEGTLGLRLISPGAYVEPSTVVTTIDDLSVVKVDFTIPETWLARVRGGMAIKATSAAWPGVQFEGEVTVVDTRVDEVSRAATVRAVLTNAERRLLPGMLLSVAIEQGDTPVAQIPEEAISSVRDQHFVRRVERDVATKVQVELGRRTKGYVEVLSGLAAGDLVVVEGLESVHDGAGVRIADRRARVGEAGR